MQSQLIATHTAQFPLTGNKYRPSSRAADLFHERRKLPCKINVRTARTSLTNHMKRHIIEQSLEGEGFDEDHEDTGAISRPHIRFQQTLAGRSTHGQTRVNTMRCDGKNIPFVMSTLNQESCSEAFSDTQAEWHSMNALHNPDTSCIQSAVSTGSPAKTSVSYLWLAKTFDGTFKIHSSVESWTTQSLKRQFILGMNYRTHLCSRSVQE